MEQTSFHVLLQGRKVGPYDRRTIIGMRIKDTLTSEHVLLDGQGGELTVGDLIGGSRGSDFTPTRGAGYSTVQATYSGSLVAVHGKGLHVPAFKGEIEIRVQADVLRIAGRFRQAFGWKQDRVKLVLQDIVHARIGGSWVELWVQAQPGCSPQRIALELFTPEAAGQLVDWLPAATLPPDAVPERTPGVATAPGQHMLWVSAGSVAVVVGIMFAVLLARRLY